jgi:hypothetical protein
MCLKAYQLTLTDEERLLALCPWHGLAARTSRGRFSHKVSFEVLIGAAYGWVLNIYILQAYSTLKFYLKFVTSVKNNYGSSVLNKIDAFVAPAASSPNETGDG